MILTLEEATECCAEWQRRLRLQDWTIAVSIVRKRDLHGERAAEVDWILTKKMAFVGLLDPVDYPPNCMLPQDHEWDLVHELLHLHFAPFSAPDGSPEEIAQEQAIDLIARALVDAKRGAGGVRTYEE